MIELKSALAIERMKEAGKIVAYVHEALQDACKPGVTTRELDEIAERIIRKAGATPSFKGYGGFPGSICASVNEQVVHGIPGEIILKDGDIISLDVGAFKNGYHGDAARTHGVGTISTEASQLINVTRDSFYEGLKYCKVGYRLQDISHAIQTYVENNGFSVVRDLVGHGIGESLHEDPPVPNYGRPNKGPRLAKGMALAIEPMVNVGGFEVYTLEDDWTVVTMDNSLSAHYEHTIVITDDEPLILTKVD